MPAALATLPIAPRPPRIHVHVRDDIGGKKKIERDFSAISTLYSSGLGLFHNQEITRVNITPPAAFDFVRAVEEDKQMSCISCSNCGYTMRSGVLPDR